MRVGHLVLRFLGFVLLAPVVLSLAPATYAYHQATSVTWPNGSFLWLSSRVYHGSYASVVSNNCNFTLWEQPAIANATSETANQPAELGDMTPGYNLSWQNCGGATTDYDDILLNYMDQTTWKNAHHDANGNASTAGGITNHNPGSNSGWCGRVGTYNECGDHVVTIDLNMYKVCGYTDPCDLTKICGGPNSACVVPSDGRYDLVRLLMHEMGHATGLDEHCTDDLGNPSDAIMNNGDSIPLSNPPQPCNPGQYGAKWTETGQWYSTDRVGLYDVYHPHDDKNPSVWQAVKVISDGPGGLQINGTPMPRADVFSGSGRIFVGWNDGWNGVWNMAYSDDTGETWTIANEPAYSESMGDPGPAAMLAHNYGSLGSLSFYARYHDFYVVPNAFEIWRITWSGTSGTWGTPVREYMTQAPTGFGIPLVAHNRDDTNTAIAWTEYSGSTPNIKFSFIDDLSGAFTGPVETVQTGNVAGGLVFDESGNPKIVYRVSGVTGDETGTGARRIRIGGTWGAEQTFTIDGLTEPDAFLLLETEQSSDWYGDCLQSGPVYGTCWTGAYASIDHYALKHVASPLTFRRRKRLGGDSPGAISWSDQDINFATLPRPITGPNTAVYWAHGLTRLMFRMKSLVVGTVWTSANVSSPHNSDLWFIK